MKIIKITDIANEMEENPTYIHTVLDVEDIEGIIAAFQQFISFYTDYGEYCRVSKEMILELLTLYCDCRITTANDAEKWIDISEILYGRNIDTTLYLPHIRRIKKTTFFQKICNFFDDENCVDCIYEYNLETILNRY